MGLGALVGGWVHRNRFGAQLLESSLVLRWEQLVGHKLATRTQPIRVVDGVLTLRVASSAWLNELTFLRDTLLKQLNERLASAEGREGRAVPKLRGLRLVVGRLGERPAALQSRKVKRSRPARVSAARWQHALQRAGEELDGLVEGDLALAIRRARAAQLARRDDDESQD
jgi:hypothetical protein